MNRLRQMSDILIEVSKSYDSLQKKKELAQNSEEKRKIDEKIMSIKNQILYLLTAIKKLSEAENV